MKKILSEILALRIIFILSTMSLGASLAKISQGTFIGTSFDGAILFISSFILFSMKDWNKKKTDELLEACKEEQEKNDAKIEMLNEEIKKHEEKIKINDRN